MITVPAVISHFLFLNYQYLLVPIHRTTRIASLIPLQGISQHAGIGTNTKVIGRYSVTHSLNVSGNVKLGSRWNVNYSSGYDFNTKEMSMTTVNISRDLHCFNMSCGLVFGPFTSYNFSIRANSSMLIRITHTLDVNLLVSVLTNTVTITQAQ